jgi:hypothetical protein
MRAISFLQGSGRRGGAAKSGSTCTGGAGSGRFLSVEGLKAESGLNPDNNDTYDARYSHLCHPINHLSCPLRAPEPPYS